MVLARLLLTLCGMGTALAAAPTPTGDWQGILALPQGQSLPLVLHLSPQAGAPQGEWSATLDSPAQSAFGLPVQRTTLKGQTLTLELPALFARYVGTLSEQGNVLAGTWSQGSSSFPLRMTRATGMTMAPVRTTPVRPQTPHPPFSYRSEDIAFDNPSGPSHLAGTLTVPEGKGPFPAVILITGSGLQDRDETIAGHRPFLLWADTLTRRGIAVLRLDDRQRGRSTGPVAQATTADFATDIEAALRFMRQRQDIDPKRIGLMGHSEGGVIAAMIAAHDKQISFIVLLEAPAVPGRQTMLAQRHWSAARQHVPETVSHQSDLLVETVLNAMTPQQSQKAAEQAASAAWNRLNRTQSGLPDSLHGLTLPAIRFYDRYDPASVLSKVDCPVLATMGSKDRQVPPELNLPALKRALAHNSQARIIELPDLNHLLQKAGSGDPGEYALIENDIDPSALKAVTDWIEAHDHR